MRRAAQDRRRRAISRLAVGSAATVVVVAVSAVVARAASERLPPEQVRTVLRTTVRLAGRDPALPWPARGEAALALGAGGLIGTSGPSAPLPTASVAKVMTAYLVLRDHPLAPGRPGFVITVTPAQAAGFRQRLADGESLLRVHAAETLTEWQALQALLLASADNIADILAEDDAGTVGAFVAKMNAAAHALGMTHTLFTDPSGLDPRTASDATDLLPLAQAAMAVPAFAALVDERQADIPGVATFGNYDTLAGTDGFTGIKTGSTDAAGQNFLFSVGRTIAGKRIGLLGDVLGQRGPGVATGVLDAARRLVDAYFGRLSARTVLPAGTTVATISRAGTTTRLITRAPLKVVTNPGATVHLTVALQGRSGVPRATIMATGPDGAGSLMTVRASALPSASVAWRLGHLW